MLRHAGGGWLMAQVLAAGSRAGLAAVLVAVELVFESGVLSAEHVENVLARLSAAPLPEHTKTSLALKEAPVANTGRYYILRVAAAGTLAVNHACLIKELKELRLHGMADAWSDLVTQGEYAGPRPNG